MYPLGSGGECARNSPKCQGVKKAELRNNVYAQERLIDQLAQPELRRGRRGIKVELNTTIFIIHHQQLLAVGSLSRQQCLYITKGWGARLGQKYSLEPIHQGRSDGGTCGCSKLLGTH